MRRRPTNLQKLITALCVVAMLIPAGGVLANAPDPESKLGEVREQIGEVQENLQGIERERVVTVDDLQVIDAELSILDTRLAELGSELAGAERGLATIEQRLAVTTSELVQTEQQLDRTQDRLAVEREAFAERTRASYMFGGPSTLSAIVNAESVSDLGRSFRYIERVMERDRDRLNVVSGLVREVTAATEDLEHLQNRQAEERGLAAAERDRVAGLVTEEQQVRQVADGERQKRQLVLNQLDADRDSHVALVASLEAESDAIEEELRRLAEEEARRAAEEEAARLAAAEVEAARVAAAEREAQERRAAEASRPARSAPALASAPESGSEAAPAPATVPAPAPASSGQLQQPADGRVTSSYGMRTHPIFGTQRMHTGIDYGPGFGGPIYAAESGRVISASARGAYGNTIILDHGGGLTTLYAHQSRYAVSAGQTVTRGQVIGYVGSTGNSTGPHLHFEVRVNGAHRNPAGYL